MIRLSRRQYTDDTADGTICREVVAYSDDPDRDEYCGTIYRAGRGEWVLGDGASECGRYSSLRDAAHALARMVGEPLA